MNLPEPEFLSDPPLAAIVTQSPLLAGLDSLAEQGQLRRLGAAFARFMVSLGMTDPVHVLSCAVLSELEGRGHACLMLEMLADDPCLLLGWSQEQWQRLSDAAGGLPAELAGWRTSLQNCAQVQYDGAPDLQQPLVFKDDRLYLRRYWRDETQVAAVVGELTAIGSGADADAGRIKIWLDKLFDVHDAGAGPDWQKIACAIAMRSHFSIITGGPGTGKTYTVARLLALLFALSDAPERLRIALAAPTGKAAARLKQSIDSALTELSAKVAGDLPLAALTARLSPARTLHSLLGARPGTRAFGHHAGNPLDIDVLIVDEASMVHLEMMASLLDALPKNAMLILLGDKDQLASVEAGAVLGDLCRHAEAGGYSDATLHYIHEATGQIIPPEFMGESSLLAQQTVMLRHSRRFNGPIGDLAAAVNQGRAGQAMACLRTRSGASEQQAILFWQEQAQAEQLLQLALSGRAGCEGGYSEYLRLLPACPETTDVAYYEKWVMTVLQAFDSFRLLCAVRDGEWGVAGLNKAIELCAEAQGLIKRRSEWYVGRPVMVTQNDAGIQVFNGDIGITLPDPVRRNALRVYFLEGQLVRSVLATRLRHAETAYAMTVHKSQGSEFHHTVVVLPRECSPVITRELVYTGITRSKKYFTLITPVASVFEAAINTRTQRASGLGAVLHPVE